MKYTPEDCYLSLLSTFSPKESPSETIKNAWAYVLKDVQESTLRKTVQYFIENWTTEPYKPRMPTQADFLKQCKDIQKQIKQAAQFDIEEKEIKPLSKKEAEKLYKNLIKTVSKIKTKEDPEPEKEKIVIYEMYSPSTEKYFYTCRDHVKKDDFIKACIKQFMFNPAKVSYFYQRFKQKIRKDSNGKIISVSSGYVVCSKSDKNAEKFTGGRQ